MNIESECIEAGIFKIKTLQGVILNIKSEKGNGNIEFPEFYTIKEFEEQLLNEKIEWNKETEYSQKQGNRKLISYELHILTGPLKNEKFTRIIEQ